MKEARQKLSELVGRAGKGERIGITDCGKLVAYLEPPSQELILQEAFAGIEKIRKRARPRPKGIATKNMIEEGRT